jgi:hypothetical protein
MLVHYGRPYIGFFGWFTRCGKRIVSEERWTMDKGRVTCPDCKRKEGFAHAA